eukprot:1182521-Prorocentrum_minimum.AAC.1
MYNLNYSHGPVASQRPVKGKNADEAPKRATGATVHSVSEEIQWYAAFVVPLRHLVVSPR